MSAKSVCWGIISTARIAETAFIPALRQTQHGQLVAVASRDRARAEAFAAKHEIPIVYDDYHSLLASDEIDAVYNPLPNTLHAEWTAVAAQEGKHVFCEKPLAMSPAEAQQMVRDCRAAGVLLFEAFVFLYHPQSLKLREILDGGRIGNLLQLQAQMSFPLTQRTRNPAENIRLNQAVGGGSLLDAGSYPITFARFAMDAEPVAVQAAVHIAPDLNIDTRVAMLLTFAGDRYATLQTGFDAAGGPGATLMGDKGYITIPQPYHPRGQSYFTINPGQDDEERISFETGTMSFTPAIEHFQACILYGEEPIRSADYAAGTARIIQAALASSQTGRRIDLPSMEEASSAR